MKNFLINFVFFRESPFSKEFTNIFLKVIILWILFAIFEGAGISLLYPIIELLQFKEIKTDSNFTNILKDFFDFLKIPFNFISICLFAIPIIGIRFYIYYFKNKFIANSIRFVEFSLRQILVEGLYNANLKYFYLKKEGDWSSAFSYDLVRARHIIQELCEIIGNSFLIFLYTLILAFISFDLLLYCFPILIFGLFILRAYRKYFEKLGKEFSVNTSSFLNLHDDVMKNIIFIKMRGIAKNFIKKIMIMNDKISSSQFFFLNNNIKIDAVFGFVLLIGVFYILLVARLKLDLELFQIAIFLFILNKITPCLQKIIKSSFNFIVYFQCYKQIIKLFNKCKKNKEFLYGKKDIKENIKKIEFEKIFFTHDKRGQYTLQNLNFKIFLGESLGIIGGSGSGKSTLLNLLLGFYKYQSGMIKVNDINLKDIDLLKFRKRISYLPQNPEIFNDTIKNNLIFGLSKSVNKNQLEEVLNQCFCDFIFDLPDGINTIVGDRGLMLSGGQRQRLIIARAILNNSEVFVLDEATNGLDENSEERIKKTLEKVKSNTIQIICAHKFSTIENTDRLIYLEKGKIKIMGSTKTLKNDSLIKNFFKKN